MKYNDLESDNYKYPKPKGWACIPFDTDPEDEVIYLSILDRIAYKRWEENRWNEF